LDISLSDRLLAIARLVPAGAKIADIGTDHALLPTYLILSGKIKAAIASDIVAGPYEAARRTVAEYGVSPNVSIRLGPGLTTVEPKEVDTVVIAGMGGATVVQIMSESPAVVNALSSMVISPMNGSEQVRRHLYHNGHQIAEEHVVVDDGRLYEVIGVAMNRHIGGVAADPAYLPYHRSETTMSNAFLFGPLNLQRADETTISLVATTATRWRHVCSQMSNSAHAAAQSRRQALVDRLDHADTWLQEQTSAP